MKDAFGVRLSPIRYVQSTWQGILPGGLVPRMAVTPLNSSAAPGGKMPHASSELYCLPGHVYL
jgi:hypothetical protein